MYAFGALDFQAVKLLILEQDTYLCWGPITH